MPLIELTFPSPINASVQPGDTAYFVDIGLQSVGGFFTPQDNADMVEIGPITQITVGANGTTIQCDTPDTTPSPTMLSFIFFGKNRAVNESSLVGYYGKFTFVNDSKDKAELFSVACEIAESSK